MSDMATSRVRAPAPAVLDLVSADEISALLASTQHDLDMLEREAVEVSALADAAEESGRSSSVDTGSTTWTIVRLQRFLDDLRVEAHRDAAAVVDIARHQARLQRDGGLSTVGMPDAWYPTSPTAAPPIRPEAATRMVDVVPPILSDAVAPVVDPIPPTVPHADPLVVSPPPSVVPEVTRSRTIATTTAMPATVASGRPAPPAPADEQATTDVRIDAATRSTRSRSVRILPLSAVLEVLVVLLLLVFIVVRLS